MNTTDKTLPTPKFDFVETEVSLPVPANLLCPYHTVNIVPKNTLLLTSLIRPYRITSNNTILHRRCSEMIFLSMNNFFSINQFIYYINEVYAYFRIYENNNISPIKPLTEDVNLKLLLSEDELKDVDDYFSVVACVNNLLNFYNHKHVASVIKYKSSISNIDTNNPVNIHLVKCMLKNLLTVRLLKLDKTLEKELFKFIKRIFGYLFSLSRSCKTSEHLNIFYDILEKIIKSDLPSQLVLRFSRNYKLNHFQNSTNRTRRSISQILSASNKLPSINSGVVIDEDLMEILASESEFTEETFSDVKVTEDDLMVKIKNISDIVSPEVVTEPVQIELPNHNLPSETSESKLQFQFPDSLKTLFDPNVPNPCNEIFLPDEVYEETSIPAEDVIDYSKYLLYINIKSLDAITINNTKSITLDELFSEDFYNSLLMTDIETVFLEIQNKSYEFTMNQLMVLPPNPYKKAKESDLSGRIVFTVDNKLKITYNSVINLFKYFV